MPPPRRRDEPSPAPYPRPAGPPPYPQQPYQQPYQQRSGGTVYGTPARGPDRTDTPAPTRLPGPRRTPPPERGRPAGPPPRRRSRPRSRGAVLWPAVATVAVLVIVGGLVRLVFGSPWAAGSTAAGVTHATPTPTPTPSPTPPPLPPLRFRATTVHVDATGFFSWALMDRRTHEIWDSGNTGTTWPASMIKGWLTSDFLRRAGEKGQTPNAATLAELERMIRDSDNNAAQDIFVRNGGNASISRLISMCKLTDTAPDKRGWSFAAMSARDAVRMADCIGNGTAAGPKWTDWVLEKMRLIRVGDFGIRKALPPAEAATVSIKNGWLLYDDDHNWHINCMAITDTWAMVVLQRYPGKGNYNAEFQHGQDVCKQVATQLLNPDYPGT